MTDWTCPCPRVSRLVCEDEVSGLAINKKYIICQFWIQPEIAVFSRHSLELLRWDEQSSWHHHHQCHFRILEGHEYGGQCLRVLDTGLVFSASLDRTLRTWRLEPGVGVQVDQAEDHTDYVQSLFVESGWVATGGQGDKKIMVYKHNILGKLSR